MSREDATGIPYDASLDALTNPGAANDFFQLHDAQSEAAWCAEFSRLAYADLTSMVPQILDRIGFEPVAVFDRAGNQAFLAEGPDFAVLAFRGSDDLEAWMTNFNLRLTPWRGGGQVHTGFAEALDAVRPEVSDALAGIESPLLCTGHSLGGALAALAASLLPEARVYTFGAPRVGDTAFRDAMAARPGLAARYVDDRDIVCRVPPAAFGYRHVGLPYVIDRDGNVAQRRPEERGVGELVASALSKGRAGLSELVGNGLPRELSDHAPINYVSALR